MKITKELLEKLYQIRYKKLNKNPDNDLPNKLFHEVKDDYEENVYIVFNKDNWNSGQDLLRYFLLFIYDYNLKNHIIYENKIDIHILFKDDTWTGVIIDRDNNDVYYISWYKSRGRTDKILKNGEPITLDEYLEILNILEENIPIFEQFQNKLFHDLNLVVETETP